MKKSEIQKLLSYIGGLFPNFKVDDAAVDAWQDYLKDHEKLDLNAGRQAARDMRNAGDWADPRRLVEAWRQGLAKQAQRPKIVRQYEVDLEELPDKVLTALIELPETEEYQLNGRAYIRTTRAGMRVHEHYLKQKNPRAVKIVTEFDSGKSSFFYR